MNTEKQSENTFSEQTKRLEQQISFIREMDKEKFIGRQTYLSDGKRKENDAEHAWHLALMTFLLSEYANEPIDVLKTMVMVLFHDVVEIDAGDTYAYDEDGKKTQAFPFVAAFSMTGCKLSIVCANLDSGVFFASLWGDRKIHQRVLRYYGSTSGRSL